MALKSASFQEENKVVDELQLRHIQRNKLGVIQHQIPVLSPLSRGQVGARADGVAAGSSASSLN
eukprot:4197718-Pyramimonas_sp.AAC.1